MSAGLVRIKGLKIRTRIGVPDEERADWQSLELDVEMTPELAFGAMGDEIDNTVDYHAVCLQIAELAEAGPRRLIETLADDVASLVLSDHPVSTVTVRLRKFILPQTDWVGVELTRGK